ncbi:MAG: GNAT family N-acetyltransferase [Chloroflexi bacterium]|nr:GNAT family N-acetyltransferase [Chloroflexota bacterium]
MVSGSGGEINLSKYEKDVLLKDGTRIKIRPIKTDDSMQCLGLVSGLSAADGRLHFHHFPEETDLAAANRLCAADYKNTFALVAEALITTEMVGMARYYRLLNRDAAEIVIAIEKNYQGRGIGTQLLGALAEAARDNGITTFEADVVPDNEAAVAILRNYGFHISSQLRDGINHVTFPIVRTKRIARIEEERERTATVSSLRPIISPRSVAVIGASRQPGTIGQLLLQCLLQGGFTGVVYPVNPNAEAVMSVKAYPSVLDIPGEVELALIAVPASVVNKVADECGRKGVRAIIVISDGFKERGAEGAARERELREIAMGHGMRLVGPNCMGVINTDPNVRLNATFSRIFPPSGNLAFLSQSGALGLTILEHASNLNLGISSFVSAGNRADVSSNDMLEYWEQDPATGVILLYLESFGNPRKFVRIARRVSAKKPVVAIKGGSTAAGLRAATSHTGALAESEIVSDTLFSQIGVIRVNTMDELFEVATLLANQPVPGGNRVAIVTNGGGPGILAADACEERGLLLPQFSPGTTKKLRSAVARETTLNNPLDLTAGASAAEFERVLKILAEDEANDAVIAIFVPPIVIDIEEMENAIKQTAPLFLRYDKPLLTCFMGQKGAHRQLGSRGRFVPSYMFPEDAVSALSRAVEYGQWRRRPKGKIPRITGLRRQEAQRIVLKALSSSTRRPLWLSPAETGRLLDCYGIRAINTLVARSPAEAARMASHIGFPIAVKLASLTITHKTDVGGVVLDLNSTAEVRQAFTDIKSKLKELGRESEMEGVMVQPMVKDGLETIVGMTQDPSFGPVIMLGMGGTYAELFKDVAFRQHPLTDLDARELIMSIRMARLFDGYRGSPPYDSGALEDLLLRVSALVDDLPQVAEMDLNPVKLMPRGEGYRVIDSRIMVR